MTENANDTHPAPVRTALPFRLMPSPNHEPRTAGSKIDMLLLHYTGMESARAARAWLISPESKVSSHYLVDVNGEITLMVDEDRRAWHAGQSHWKGETDTNSRSIGIEIQNGGHAARLPPFPKAQMRALINLCLDIQKRHHIQPPMVLAHYDVAPLRKIDPGEAFDWGLLHKRGIGAWVEAEPLVRGRIIDLGERGKAVANLQRELKCWGYDADINGDYDKKTEAVVAAFQRHFRPGRVDGRYDLSTRTTLKNLLKKYGPQTSWWLPANGTSGAEEEED